MIRRFDFPTSKQNNFWVHFNDVAVADWFKSLPSILPTNNEESNHVPRMFLKGAFQERFLVNIYEYENIR